MAKKLFLSATENGTIVLRYTGVFSQTDEIVAYTTRPIELNGIVCVIDKATGVLKSDCLKFKPWGKVKWIKAIMRGMI